MFKLQGRHTTGRALSSIESWEHLGETEPFPYTDQFPTISHQGFPPSWSYNLHPRWRGPLGVTPRSPRILGTQRSVVSCIVHRAWVLEQKTYNKVLGRLNRKGNSQPVSDVNVAPILRMCSRAVGHQSACLTRLDMRIPNFVQFLCYSGQFATATCSQLPPFQVQTLAVKGHGQSSRTTN